MSRLSIVVITYNEEHKLRRCLDPVRWADEIIVVDSYSTDRTVDIAREYTERVYQNPWAGFAAQRTFGMERATGDWVLFLDADEYVTDELNARLRSILTDGTPDDGFKIHRVEHFLGYPIRYGTFNPSYQPRLLRRGKGYWTGGAHAHFEVDGTMGIIEEDLYHDSHNTIAEFITRINAYTTIDAQERFERGQRVGRARVVLSPIGMWWKCLIVKQGYRDGFPGFLLSIGMGIYSFLRLVKVWQLNQEPHPYPLTPFPSPRAERGRGSDLRVS
ncbi:MAG: glycosyltransferase family 2 protein [Candidatus Latescibacteria bacterium]|nr:glycosyltransferase family 2 protein [Candidatus Latescibacterota bacterium]